MHEEIKAWEKRVDDMCADFPPKGDTESHTDYPSYELEAEVGHLMMAGEIDATEALKRLDDASQ